MSGLELLRVLVEATGLPEASVTKELTEVCSRLKINPELMTMDQLREVMATYLQEVLVKAKDQYGA